MTASQVQAFVALVAAMREAQHSYFRTRLREDLLRARDCERRVDTALRELTAPEDEPELPLGGNP
jgi:hypothetical protein